MRINKNLPGVAFLKCCMSPIFGPFSKFSGRWGKSGGVSWCFWAMGESHVKHFKLLFYVFSITVPFHGMNLVWNHTILTAVDVYWWLSAWTGYVNCPACWIILPHPWGKLIKLQLFGKHNFNGFCENLVFLILPRNCSQKIKDSESKLINSSIFIVSPPRSQEKRCLTLPHFALQGYRMAFEIWKSVQ